MYLDQTFYSSYISQAESANHNTQSEISIKNAVMEILEYNALQGYKYTSPNKSSCNNAHRKIKRKNERIIIICIDIKSLIDL